ncbi:hypothetical protein ACH5RR_013028, partial [Cinchona calisaya]
MLAREESLMLLTLLNGGDSRPFDELISEFTCKIHPSRIFAFCSAVTMLLTDARFLSQISINS